MKASRRNRSRAPDPVPARTDPWLWWIAGAALVVKLIVVAQLHDDPLLQPLGVLDTATYFKLAERAAGGDWALGPGAYYVSPLYIYFLAVLFRVLGAAPLHAQVAQAALGAVAVALAGRCAERLFGGRAGRAAAALAALTGVLTFNEALVLQSALDPFLAALALERLAAAVTGPSARRLVLAGLAFGLLGLNRPNALAAVALVVLVAATLSRSRTMLGHAALLAAGVGLALAPVAVRNRVVAGEWLLVASHGGLNFAIGNNPNADGTYLAPPGITPSIEGQTRDTRRVAEAAAGRPLTDSEVSDHFYRTAFRWIRDQPARAAALFVRKLVLTFHRADVPLNYSYAYWSRDEPTLLQALVVGPWLLVPLGIAGLLVPRAVSTRAFVPWATFIPAYALSLAVFFVASRYRLPLLVALCVTAGGALGWLQRAMAARSLSGVRPVAAAAALAAVVAYWPLAVDEGVANERTERLVHLIVEGKPDAARALLARTEPIHKDPGLLHYRVGRAWLDARRPDLAVEELGKSLAAAPGQGEVQLVLGQALLALQRPSDAIPHLQEARARNVFPDTTGLDLARALAAVGRRDEARAAVSATPLLEDSDAPTALALGDLALQLDDAAAAARFLEAAGRLDPSEPTGPYNLALLYARAGRMADARRSAERALALDPAAADTRSLLEDLQRR